jgi:hypothetical protein
MDSFEDKHDNGEFQDDVLDFLKQNPKDIALYIKRNIVRINKLILLYLDVLPSPRIKFVTKSYSPYKPCHAWFFNLLVDIPLHCKHCANYTPDCTDCFEHYKKLLEYFCQNCSYVRKTGSCNYIDLQKLKAYVKSKKKANIEERAFELFAAECYFDNIHSDKKYETNTIMLFKPDFEHLKLTEDIFDKFRTLHDKLFAFLSPWVKLLNYDSSRRISECAYTILAFHYLFFKDVINKTVFLNSNQYNKEGDYFEDNESTNVVFAAICKREGASEKNIEASIANNINPNESIIARRHKESKEIIFGTTQIYQFVDSLLALYTSDFLTNIYIKDINDKWMNFINRYARIELLSKTNVIVNNPKVFASIDHDINPLFLKYKIFIRLLGLLEAIKKTRLTRKIPFIFKDDNLLKLWEKVKQLQNQYEIIQSEKKRHPQKDERFFLKKACQNLDFLYTTVYIGLDEKLKSYHPGYARLKESMKKEKYSKITNYLLNSEREEIIKWKEKVETSILASKSNNDAYE